MALTKDEVSHVAKLARIHLSDELLEKFTHQLESIFKHLEKLSELNTEGVEETSQINTLRSVTRPDLVTPSLSQEAFLKTSDRDSTRGMITVRKSL